MSMNCLFKSLFITIFCLTGCSSMDNNPNSDLSERILEMSKTAEPHDIRDYSLFNPSKNHNTLGDYVERMIMDFQFSAPFDTPIAIASFVDFDGTLRKTNSLGNQLAETFLIEMSQAGYAVADINASGWIDINANGGFVFTRQQDDGFDDICCALSGNLIYQTNGVRVYIKYLAINTHTVGIKSSAVVLIFWLSI